MSKIIVTGSEGLLGSVICGYLREKGNEIYCIDIKKDIDLTHEETVRLLFQTVRADYLVNLFALNDIVSIDRKAESLFDISLVSFRKYMEVNVVALFNVCKHFAYQKEARGIINFSSTYGIVSPRNDMYGKSEKHIGYSVSKGAVIMLTKHLAVHLAPGIRVNCIVPGGVENNQPKEFIDKYSQQTPMKRMMKKDELNGLVGFLCSEESSYMTGSVIMVDGGWTVW